MASTPTDAVLAWLDAVNVGDHDATRAVYADRDAVVVAQRGVWRDAEGGGVRGQADIATRFRVTGGHVAEIQRYDDLAAALRDVGLTAAAFEALTPGRRRG